MKRFAAATVVVVLIGAGVVALARADAAPQPIDYVIRVTSAAPGTEVTFDAAVLFKAADAPLQTFSHETPYALRATGLAASAMFRAQGSAAIQVELVGMQAGKRKSQSKASGRAVVVGDNVVHDSGYISTF